MFFFAKNQRIGAIFVIETYRKLLILHTGKTIIANFLLILFVSMQGSFILNKIQIHQHKHTEKKSSRKNIYLTFTASDWRGVEKVNDDEIRIKGKMFDVKSISFHDGKVTVFGHYDSKEDKLLANAKELDKKKGEQKKNASFDNTLFFEHAHFSSVITYTGFLKRNYTLFSQNYLFHYNNTESPPPKVSA